MVYVNRGFVDSLLEEEYMEDEDVIEDDDD